MASASIDLGPNTGAFTPSGAAGGDLSGNYPNPTVAKVLGVTPVSTNTASAVVLRDGSGNFAAGTITANLTGSITGLLLTSKTTAQRLALTGVDGEMVYDTDLRCLFIYNVSRWFPAQPIDPVSGFLIHEDWANNQVPGNTAWLVTGNTGSDSGLLFDSNTGAVGQVYLEQANATGGYATLYYGNSYALGAQSMFFDARCYVTALSTGAQEYIVYVGFGDSTDDSAFSDGIFFCYDRATDGDFWSCKTTSSGSTTKTVTAVAPTAAAYQLLSVYATAASVKFYIAGVLVATHTTNITTAITSTRLKIVKTVGATARRLVTDFFTTYSFFNTRRI